MSFLKPVVLAISATLLLAPVAGFAEKGGKEGKESRSHGNKHEERYDERKHERSDERRGPERPDRREAGRHEADRRDRGGATVEFRFGDQDQRMVRDYYGDLGRRGNCPPGLAKKHNGCLPPGQAKKWVQGRPLPRDLRYYDVPHDLLVRMPPPPPGHRYVRVAGDILLIAIGSSMVVDAIQDIMR